MILLLAAQQCHHDSLEEDTLQAVYQNRLQNRLYVIRLKTNWDSTEFDLNNLILYFKTFKKQCVKTYDLEF